MIVRIKQLCLSIVGLSPVRYLMTGGALFAIDLAVFLTLKHLDASTPLAQVVSRTVGAAVGFVGHKAFSFRNRDRETRAIAVQGGGYLACTILNIIISPFIVTGVELLLPYNLTFVKIVAEVVMVTETYFVLRWVFKIRARQGPDRGEGRGMGAEKGAKQ